MRSRAATVLLAVLVLAGSLLAPTGPDAAAETLKPTQVHIQVFGDGSLEVVGTPVQGEHLTTSIEVPDGSRVLDAHVDLSRMRFTTLELPLAAAPRSIWCGDLDRDGMNDDVIVVMPDADSVEVLSLDGEPPALYPTVTLDVPDPTAVAVDDLDRDNDKDILVTSGSHGSLYVFENLGVATFAEPRVSLVGPRPCSIEVTDLTPDFTRDVVVTNSGGSSVTVLQGRGDLMFYPRLYEMGAGPSAARFRDMDRDGFVDLVVAESRNDTVTVYYNEGNGNFTRPKSLPTGEGPVALDVEDLNRDSLLDIAVACTVPGEVWVYEQLPDGNFTLGELLTTGKAPRSVQGVQANKVQDSNLDVVTACSGSDNLTIYLAGGNLAHTIPVDVPVAGRPVATGMLRNLHSGVDTIVVACQIPPSLVLVENVAMAEIMKVGLGRLGIVGTTELPMGTDRGTVNLTAGLQRYIETHHDEARTGTLTVPLEAWSVQPGALRLSDLSVWVQPNRPPRADAGRNVTVLVGEPATLNGSASYDPDGGPLQHLWLLPGSTEPAHTDAVAQHMWSVPGTYTILLVVQDPWDLQDQDVVWVIVNAPPVARVVVPDQVYAMEPVRLSAHLSEDPDGSIVDYIWDYGQGVVHGRSVDVVFTGSGAWNVTLEVVDDVGARTVTVHHVEVLPARTPLREPAQAAPADRGEVPGAGVLMASTTLMLAAVLATLARRRR